MKITEQEFLLRKDRIIETAFHLFCKNGIDKTSMLDIAKASEVSESTMYRYFSTKTLLVYSTLSILWTRICGVITEKVKAVEGYNEMSGIKQVAVQLESCRQLYSESSEYVLFSYESKLYLLRNKYHLSKLEYDALMNEIYCLFTKSLRKGIDDGSIPITNGIDDTFYAIWGTLRGYIVKIVIYSALCQTDSPWEQRYNIVENGILTALASGWNYKDS